MCEAEEGKVVLVEAESVIEVFQAVGKITETAAVAQWLKLQTLHSRHKKNLI